MANFVNALIIDLFKFTLSCIVDPFAEELVKVKFVLGEER